jgi:3-deoxy-7-phosphoheptulonate synthase
MKESNPVNNYSSEENPLLTPKLAKQQAPLSYALEQRVAEQREAVLRILRGEDQRMLVIAGPCSVHDPVSALDYAKKLSELSKELKESLLVLMRIYVQKPRTELGWQGFLLDPSLDGQGDVNAGILATRELMGAVIELGLGVATEYLSPMAESYVGDLAAWAAIGARSVESQLHRNFISGLSLPVGCKNSRSGSIDSAISTLVVGSHPQQYLGIDANGQVALIKTSGNPNCHVVLRGGSSGPNFDELSLARLQDKLHGKDVMPAVIVDCSHGNSGSDYRKQSQIAREVAQSFQQKKLNVRGVMLESYLVEGKQKLVDPAALVYGQSITDCCLGWEDTAKTLRDLAERVS